MAAISGRSARHSPFRETEWDRRLDYMLEDLESSRQPHTSSHSSSSQARASSSGRQVLSSSYQSYSAHQRSQSSSSALRSGGDAPAGLTNGYAVTKSKSGGSLHDNMLKDLEGSLKASSDYLESRRTVTGPGGTREYHEYRSYTSGGTGGGDFDLERQVQHMMPPGSLVSQQQQRTSNVQQQSSSMMQQQQQQQRSYTAYKVQSNQYGGSSSDDRPGSRLKQNIDELDNLLDDLNNARSAAASEDYTAATSTDDYSYGEGHQGHVKRTVHTYNETEYTARKPPSPQPPARAHRPGLPSPGAVRRVSPGPTRVQQQQQQQSSSLYSYSTRSAGGGASGVEYQGYYDATTPPTTAAVSDETKPTGAAYYAKYHSTHSHASSGASSGGAFPATPTATAPKSQTPPKRVDQLMSELSEFDSSIQHTPFKEPVEKPAKLPYREPSPTPPPAATKSTPGPAVYYPPGEMFSATKAKQQETALPPQTESLRSADSSTVGNKNKSSKSKVSPDGEGKQGAAVVPICLPLCCAAPCVIL